MQAPYNQFFCLSFKLGISNWMSPFPISHTRVVSNNCSEMLASLKNKSHPCCGSAVQYTVPGTNAVILGERLQLCLLIWFHSCSDLFCFQMRGYHLHAEETGGWWIANLSNLCRTSVEKFVLHKLCMNPWENANEHFLSLSQLMNHALDFHSTCISSNGFCCVPPVFLVPSHAAQVNAPWTFCSGFSRSRKYCCWSWSANRLLGLDTKPQWLKNGISKFVMMMAWQFVCVCF